MNKCEKKRSPLWGFGSFLIAFGLLLAAVMVDLLGLGDPGEYVKWQILLIFIGIISLINAKITEAVLLFAVGFYFLLPHLSFELPEYFEKFYWPAAIVLVGIVFIISGLVRNIRKRINK